jgi:uncharacterized protein YcaQ
MRQGRRRRISPSAARRLAIACQCLDDGRGLPRGREGAARIVERLGYVQIDTIAVVQRAHHHTLWARRPDYAPEYLHCLQADDRSVFEYWRGAACYLPMSDYRYYVPAMRGFADSPRTREWLASNARLVKEVIRRIRREGPLASADFPAPEGQKRGPWWDWKPEKQALETLFSMGELMISARRNFQRLYDLAERVLPARVSTEEPSREEMARFVVRRALTSTGAAPAGGISWGRASDRIAIAEALAAYVASGEVTPVTVSGADGGPHYAWSEALQRAPARRRRRRPLILSPFDSLVTDRRRLRDLFDFDCRLECYLPAAKRRYGYFCLPILWGDRFIGRLDPKAERKQGVLRVKKLMFEPGFADFEPLLPALAEELRSFAAFNECEAVVIEETQPRKVRRPLQRELGG